MSFNESRIWQIKFHSISWVSTCTSHVYFFHLYIYKSDCLYLMYLCPLFTPEPQDQSPPNFAQTSSPIQGRFLTQTWPCTTLPLNPRVPQTLKALCNVKCRALLLTINHGLNCLIWSLIQWFISPSWFDLINCKSSPVLHNSYSSWPLWCIKHKQLSWSSTLHVCVSKN